MKFEDVRKIIKQVQKSTLDYRNKNTVKYSPVDDGESKSEKTSKNHDTENRNIKIFTLATAIAIIYLCMFAGYRSRHSDDPNDDELGKIDALVKNEILADEIEQEILEDVEDQVDTELDYRRMFIIRT